MAAGSKDDGKRRDREHHYRRAALAHPLRRGILRLMLDGMEAGAIEIAAELNEAPGRVAYHLRVLRRRGALKGFAKDPPAPPRFGIAPGVRWARKMLAEFEKEDGDDDQGGRD
jgi:hypothetical protein